METLTIAQTARHLGISDQGVRKMIERRELCILPGTSPAKLSAEAVETQRLLRRQALLVELGSRRRTPVTLAQEVRRRLFPPNDTGVLPQHKAEHQRRRLSLVPPEARQLFGNAALTAAYMDGCRWCHAQRYAELLGGWAPTEYSEAFAALFDQQPCVKCGPGLYGSVLETLRSRVHRGAERPSAPAPRPSEAERAAAEQWARQRGVTAAARPVQDDDGRALISRRRREVQTRLKAARRRGDTRHALALQRQLQSLTADASAVDGRLAAPRGRKACGTPVGVRCECHTSDRRGQR